MMSVEACTENLWQLYQAIVHYQKLNRSLPRWLSDLYPEYLKGHQTLVCPDATPDVPVPGSDPRMRCCYAYQLQPVGIKDRPSTNLRSLKIEQLQRLGTFVPVVRCWHHLDELEGNVLNLAYSGQIYVSSPVWEEEIPRIRMVLGGVPQREQELSQPLLWKFRRFIHKSE